MQALDRCHALNAERELDCGVVLLQTSIEELTGSCKRLDRQDLWELPYKRIFFCTPQTFRNDIDRGKVCKPSCCADAGLLS